MGGGRYNDLVKELGGKDTPAIGFSIGVERMMMTADALSIKFPVSDSLDVFIAHLGEKALQKSIELSAALRDNDLKTAMIFEDKNLKVQLNAANNLKAKKVIIIGENELNAGIVILKNMKDGSQKEVEILKIAEELVKTKESL